nr:hypothetical protein BaRGS_034566 [Batillaria attramentaria]
MYGYHGKSHTCAFDRQISATYIAANTGFFCMVPMVFVGYWNFAIFRYWRQNKLEIDNRYPAIKREQQIISLTVDKSVGGDENQLLEKEDTTKNKQMGSQPASAEAKDSVSQVEQPTDQYNATMKQFHIRMKEKRTKEQAFVRSLLVVFLLTVLCFLPFGVTTIIALIDPTYGMIAEALIATMVMVFFNCSINWIVYGVMNRSFRRYYATLVRRMLGTCCRCPWPRRLWTRSTTEAQGNANASGTGTSDSAGGVDSATAQSTTV